jgi:hypothetical protein
VILAKLRLHKGLHGCSCLPLTPLPLLKKALIVSATMNTLNNP